MAGWGYDVLGALGATPGTEELREVVARVPERDPVLRVGDHTLQVRGFAAVLDGRVVELAPGPMAVLRELARDPGRVVPRPELIDRLPGGGDGHAVEMAVARLRAGCESLGGGPLAFDSPAGRLAAAVRAWDVDPAGRLRG